MKFNKFLVCSVSFLTTNLESTYAYQHNQEERLIEGSTPISLRGTEPQNSSQNIKKISWTFGTYYEPISLEIGDTIEFFDDGTKDLFLMESEKKMQACDFSGAEKLPTMTYSNLGEKEEVYFACSIGAHCTAGRMRVKVTFDHAAAAAATEMKRRIQAPTAQRSNSMSPSSAPSKYIFTFRDIIRGVSLTLISLFLQLFFWDEFYPLPWEIWGPDDEDEDEDDDPFY